MSIERGSHKDIWDTIMGGMVIVDSSYKIVDVNPDAIEKWRIKKDTVVGSSIFERVLEEDRERLKKALQLARENGNARIESIRLIHPDGKIHPVEIGIHRVEDFFVLIVITREDFWKADTNIKIIKSAIENLSEAIVVTDVNGTIQFVNSAFEKLTGYSPEEAIGQNPRILKSGKHPREFYKEMWDTILSGKIWHGELINKRKDGSLYWEEMTIVPVKDESGRVVNFVAVKHDVTERKKLEEKLQKEREFYRSVIESSPDGIFVETLDGKIIDLNERAAEMLGYRKEELLGKNVAMLLPEETRSKLSNVSRILRKRRHIILEVFNKHKKGYLVPLELSINLVTIGDKELVIIIARDLSQRHDLEIRYRAIGEMARDAIVMVDSEGRIEYWNPAAEKIFGYPQEEILGKKYFEYLVPKQYIEKLRKKTPKIFHPTQEGFKKYPVLEVWAQRKNGEKFPLEISPSIFTINGKPHGLMIGRDISQRKKKEQEILQRTEELQALYNFAKSVTSELDLQRVYRKSYRELRKIMEFDHYTIALCDEERKKLEVVFSVEGNKETTEKLRNIPLGDSITGWIVKNKKTLLIKDMEKEKAPTEIHLVGWKPRSWLGVPLLYKDKAVGALIVQSKKPNMFGNAEKRVLETLASQLAVAVMNAKLYTETEMAKERLENLINTSLVGIITTNLKDEVMFTNQKFGEMLGYSVSEITGKNIADFTTEEGLKIIKENTRKVLQGKSISYESVLRRKDGTLIDVLINASPLRDEQGRITGAMSVILDISERKRWEMELKKKNELFISLYNISLQMGGFPEPQKLFQNIYHELKKVFNFHWFFIAIYDEKNDRIYFPVFRSDEDDLSGDSIPCDPERFITARVIKTRKPLLIRDILKEVKPGSYKIVGNYGPEDIDRSLVVVPIIYRDRVVGAMSIQHREPYAYNDDTVKYLSTIANSLAIFIANYNMYEEIKKTKDLYETLINNSLVGITLRDEKDNILFANQKFGEMLGYSVSEITGKNIADFTTEEGLKIIKENTRKVLQGKSISYESVLRRKDGTLIDVLMSASPLKDSKGKIVGSVGVITDITERKRWEESIQRVNRVLSSLYNISLKMGGFPDLKRMCNIIYEELKNVLDFNWLSISIYNREDDTLYFPIMKSEMENADVSDTVIKCDPAKSLTAWVVKHRKPLLIRNLPKERPPGSFMIAGASGEEMNMEELDKSEVIVPIIYKDEVLGTIGISHPEEGAYSEEIVRYLSTIANFLAIFIANYNLYREIKKTKDMYETLINNSLVGIILTDLEDKILFANQKFAEMLGYSDASEVIGRNIREFATEAGYRKIREGTARRMKGISDSYETVLLTKDGKTIDVLIHASPLRDSDGKIIGTIGVNMDITERKRMEQRIREEWERYKGLMEKLLTGVVVIQDEKIVYVNKFMADMLGYRVEELIGEHFTRAVHPDMKEYLLENYHRRLSGEDIPESYIVKFIKRNGETVWALVRATLVEWEGKIADMVSVEDITRIKEMEDSLITLVRTFEDIKLARSEEEIYDIALNTLYNVLHFPYAAIAKITDGEIRIAKHRGYRNPNIILRLDDKKGISVWVVKHNEPYYAPDVTKDPLYVEGAPGAKCEYATPISAKDKVYGVLDVQREEVDSISEDERLLLDMLASHIGVALAGLEAMKEVEKARDLQELMVHIISHDLKNPLAVLSGYIDLLREMPSEEFLDAMEDAIKEAEEIIERARLFSKLGRKKIDEKREVINLRKFIEDAASLILKKYEGKELEIKIKDDLEITAYPILSRVFTNLIDNAFKYGATKVVVDAKDEGAMVEVRVADNGPGIPDEKKKKIFEPFERASRRKGSGLGLTIVKMIVELHGGEVWVEDNTPKGSVFVVRLPKE